MPKHRKGSRKVTKPENVRRRRRSVSILMILLILNIIEVYHILRCRISEVLLRSII